ncbi:MAG: hypothetical protein VYB30_05990 [Candidatus Thermoplasmatota archaeon]|nr:hypothetical protein [Candidatus Thermoplasmatota archaeon]
MRIAIVGIELSQLVCAHTILDQNPRTEIHLISEKAEAGLIGELPGLISQPLSNNIPDNWIDELGSQKPTKSNTAVRRSWLEKAMATKLVERGTNLHLRTTINSTKSPLGETIHLSGAGFSSGSTIQVEKVIKKPYNTNNIQWRGGVHNEELIGSDYEGHRPDGLVEIWWPADQEPPRSEGKWLQLMEWEGEDPRISLKQEVELGRSLAENA